MRRILAMDGHVAETANGGREALEKFENGKFDLVVLDLEMPGMRGDELALEIKKASPQQPVILLTAYGDMLNAMRECPPGVDRVFGKPIGFETVREALDVICAK